MYLSKAELKTLILLKKSTSGLDAFSMFSRLTIPFTEFTKVIKSLLEYDLILEKKNDFFRLSNNGEVFLSKQKNTSADKHWRQVPEKYLGSKLKKGSFYIPKISLLDEKTFKIKGCKVK